MDKSKTTTRRVNSANMLDEFVTKLNEQIQIDESITYCDAVQDRTGLCAALQLCDSPQSISFAISYRDDTWSWIEYCKLESGCEGDDDYAEDDFFVLNVEFSVDVYYNVFNTNDIQAIWDSIDNMNRNHKISTIFNLIREKARVLKHNTNELSKLKTKRESLNNEMIEIDKEIKELSGD